MLHVVWNESESNSLWKEGRDCYTAYMFTILQDLGLNYRTWDHQTWIDELPPGLTLVLGGTNHDQWTAACTTYCEQGNGLFAIGGVYGLNEVLGVSDSGAVKEGWITWEDESPANGLKSSFHFFDAVCIEINNSENISNDIKSWGNILQRNGISRENPAITYCKLGQGRASLLAVDLMKTFCMIQQGISVTRDGNPAPDGTAAIDDGFFKTDDAVVLDWVRDREALAAGAAAFFLHPVVDEWRIIFMRMLHKLQQETGTSFAQRWFWPYGRPAIGHISHDTDGNTPEHARKLLERLKEAEIHSTWCVIMPGYEAEINNRIVAEGHEIALHYNSMETEIPQSKWSEEHFQYQLSMLQEQFPGKSIVSNKNHYLRWEGDVQFHHWCERAGIRVEQSIGGTKQGNKGFLAGTCHPFWPIGKAHENNRKLDLVSLPTLSWDPPMSIRCTAEEAWALLDRALDVNGVAHFLFHPLMMIKDNDEVGAMLVALVQYGKKHGLEWWTSEQIWQWLQRRNQVKVELNEGSNGKFELAIFSDSAVQGLTLLLSSRLQPEKPAILDSQITVHSFLSVERFGCKYMELQLDIHAGKTTLTLEY